MSDSGRRREGGGDQRRHRPRLMTVKQRMGAAYPEFLAEVTFINWKRLKVFGIVAWVIFSLLLMLDGSYLSSGKWDTSIGYAILLYSHLFIWVVLGIATALAWIKPITDKKTPSRFHTGLIVGTLMLGMVTMVTITIGDVFVNGSVAAYIGLVFSFASIFIFPTWFCYLFYLTSTCFMLLLLNVAAQLIHRDLSIQCINVISFSIFAVVLSRTSYHSHVRDFQHRKLISAQKKKLVDLSRRDHLTHTLNRRSFAEISASEIERIKRYGGELSLAMFDLDHFKRINDQYGHAAGDDVLIRTAEIVRDCIRKTDAFFRWGGEEFVILSPETALPEMVSLAEKLRRAVSGCPDDRCLAVTASFGVTEYVTGESIEETVHRADQALYAAKNRGRNRVEVAPVTSPDACMARLVN